MNRLTLTEFASLTVLVLLLAVAKSTAAADPEPIRVATLLPFVEDALELVPNRVVVVASVRRSMHSPLDPDLIDLGNPHSPNFERLAEARPQIIVGDKQIHAVLADRLDVLGAQVLLIDTSGIDSMLSALSDLSTSIGGSPLLDARIAAVRKELATLELGESLRVLPLFGAPGSFYAITDRAWLGQLVTELGFDNLAPARGDERFPGLVVVSDEVISTLEPDIVLLVAHGDPRKIQADLEQRTRAGGAWASLGKASHGIHVLDPGLFAANPGLDVDRAAKELIAISEAPPAAGAGSLPSVAGGPESR